mmetsp:Transcript_105698/g.182291  ORF Transcript_105698/g.182291 Transcript_105698/m.182291 type:complete len:224 (-) Transcript_105698:136-807(-)
MSLAVMATVLSSAKLRQKPLSRMRNWWFRRMLRMSLLNAVGSCRSAISAEREGGVGGFRCRNTVGAQVTVPMTACTSMKVGTSASVLMTRGASRKPVPPPRMVEKKRMEVDKARCDVGNQTALKTGTDTEEKTCATAMMVCPQTCPDAESQIALTHPPKKVRKAAQRMAWLSPWREMKTPTAKENTDSKSNTNIEQYTQKGDVLKWDATTLTTGDKQIHCELF